MSAPKVGLYALLWGCVFIGAFGRYSIAEEESSTSELNPEVKTRQRPGHDPEPTEFPPYIYESVPDIESSAPAFVPAPDRWREFYSGKWYDPYNQNVAKADLPIFGSGDDLYFLDLSATSDTLLENRRLPFPVGSTSTSRPESNNTFGRGRQNLVVENLSLSASLINGNTSFKPPDFEFRVTPILNINSIDTQEEGNTRANPLRGDDRSDDHLGFLELFVDKHLMNLSDRYDFISARVGIQRFVSDFRGFIYSDEEPGVRLFGNWDNNKWQYNLAWFHRLEKDTNSAVNSTFDDRYEDVLIANLFRQDAVALGQTVQGSVVYRSDQAGDHPNEYDDNGFIVRPASIGDERPKNIDSTYFGLTTDGHIDRINSTGALYYVTGSESHNPIAQQRTSINAAMAALELSYDIDWIRLRASFLWASGDSDPYDGDANGFDAIFDNPNFAGGDLSFWQRQGIGFIGGGGVNLVNRASLLPNLRAGKEQGQSNFVNPGLWLYNAGVDFEVLPELKFVTNAAYLQFDKTEVLEALRQDGSLSRNIGLDLSAGVIYRPLLTNNIEIRAGAAILYVDDGLQNLFEQNELHSLFTNLIFQY